MAHGWEGAVLRALRGKNFTLRVMDTTRVTENFQRVHLSDGGLLGAVEHHPAMWARFWFITDSGKSHQRAYTIINPDSEAGTVDIDAHLHDGIAARWARNARPGDVIDVTFQGSRFVAPPITVERFHLVADAASVPAVRSILETHDDTPATIWVEQQHLDEIDIPLSTKGHHDIIRIPRSSERGIVHQARDHWNDLHLSHGLHEDWFWLANEASANRELTAHLRKTLGVAKERITSLAYWRAA